MKILIVDDSSKWITYHKSAIEQIFSDARIDTAQSAKDGADKLIFSINEPYDVILTDMQMEPDFLPLFAGEWFIKQIQFFKEYKNTKIIAVSAAENLKHIAEKYRVDYLPKYKCNDIQNYCNKLLK